MRRLNEDRDYSDTTSITKISYRMIGFIVMYLFALILPFSFRITEIFVDDQAQIPLWFELICYFAYQMTGVVAFILFMLNKSVKTRLRISLKKHCSCCCKNRNKGIESTIFSSSIFSENLSEVRLSEPEPKDSITGTSSDDENIE